MYAILAEDESDAEVIATIMKRHFNNDHMSIKRKGYGGCGGLCAKGARDIRSWADRGLKRFVICHDSDSNPPAHIRQNVIDKIVSRTEVANGCCIVVPIEEIEAWIIADADAVNKVIPSFRFAEQSRPESIRNPKEWLRNQSVASNGKPLYSPKTFNEKVAKHLRLDVVSRKCGSFRDFMTRLDLLSKIV